MRSKRDDRMFSVEGRTALIHGTDTVYGKEICEGLITAGAKVWICGDLHCEGVIPYAAGSEESAEALATYVKKNIGNIDIFIECSTDERPGGWNHSYEQIYAALKEPLLGSMLTVKHIGMLMTEAGYGSVIFVTDYAALVGCDVQNYTEVPEQFDRDFSLEYGFIKGAYVNYARQCAGYLGQHDVRCNVIALSPIEGQMPYGFEKKYIRHTDIKRMARPSDLVGAVIFLASDASVYITGITLPVDGGYTAK